ncbi:MAG: IS1634 family transposase [Candidatus Acidiferrales bacterium]
MYLKCNRRFKDGKEHRYWSLVESRRCAGGRVVQRPVLYLGEINDSQREAWIRSIEAFDEDACCQRRLTLFPSDRELPADRADAVRVRLSEFELRRPRQWGACWLFSQLWEQLGLDAFWREKLGVSREGTDWEHVLQVLTAYRLIDPGSEWRVHRQWYEHSAMGDLLGEDTRVAEKDTLYRCLDRLLAHKGVLFDHLTRRWKDLFGVRFEVLLYDLTSTYFEIDPPEPEGDKRRFGYSRDKRSDCVQVVIALIVTPEGFPLAYEVLPGNTADSTTLRGFLDRIEHQYGKAERVWVMDRGIPTEETLQHMRGSDPPIRYLVGTPKGRLSKLEQDLLLKPWHDARPGVQVKLLAQDDEMYVFAQSRDRIAKERGMRKRQLKKLWVRLKQLSAMKLTQKDLLMKLGAARAHYPAAWRLVNVQIDDQAPGFTYALRKDKLREVRRREGRYLLRTNLTGSDPAELWRYYIQLVQIEETFKNLKGDLAIRPIYHQNPDRIEAHIFVSFLAYCVHVTLRHRLRQHAPGLTPRAVLEKFATLTMLDAWFPTTDGRWLVFARYTQPEKEHRLLLATLGLDLPAQAPPRITAHGKLAAPTPVV